MAAPQVTPPTQRWHPQLLRLATLVVLGLAWETASRVNSTLSLAMPSLLMIAKALFAILFDGKFYQHLGITLWQVVASMVVGGLAGVGLGLWGGLKRRFGQAIEPYVYYLAPTPKIIILPVLILMFGVGSGSKIAMGALSCFFPILLSTLAGVWQINPVLIRVGRSFHLSNRQMLTLVYLPAVMRPVITGVRLGLGMAITGVLLSQIRLSNAGLGFLAISAFQTFQVADMYAILILVFALAALANAGVASVERRLGG
ncbi:MAG: ABC transporter permease subunit [Rhodospirillales bacterium]|nr:ABC transporter permease subunit [Rhodospirillales bacterium]